MSGAIAVCPLPVLGTTAAFDAKAQTMRLAYTLLGDQRATDLLLAALAETLEAEGLRTCGVVQTNTRGWDDHRCDMDVMVLPRSAPIRISQSLGTGSKGCRLDPAALERAAGAVEARLAQGADVLILNKFGKLEAAGRGFREVIGLALARDLPVLIGLGERNLSAYETFAQGLAIALPPDHDALHDWIRAGGQAAATA